MSELTDDSTDIALQRPMLAEPTEPERERPLLTTTAAPVPGSIATTPSDRGSEQAGVPLDEAAELAESSEQAIEEMGTRESE
jgi:hypothetical protein